MKVFDLNTCSRESLNKVLCLIKTDTVSLSSYNRETEKHDDGTYPVILCNEVFCQAPDAEEIEEKDLDLFLSVVNKHGWMGALAWVGIKRGMEPWDKRDLSCVQNYNSVCEDLKKMGVKSEQASPN